MKKVRNENWNKNPEKTLSVLLQEAGKMNHDFKEEVKPYLHDLETAGAAVATIHEIGNIITSNNSYTETFYGALYGVIGVQIVSGWYYTNKYKRFKKGVMEIGDVIQITRPKAFSGIAQSKEVGNRSGSTVDTPHRHNADVQYFAQNLKAYYKDTIDRDELKRAFATISAFGSFYDAKLRNVYNMYELDEQLVFKYLTLKALSNASAPTITYTAGATDEGTAKNILKAVRKTVKKMYFASTSYNLAGILNALSDGDRLNVIMPIDTAEDISVDALAGAFNLDKLEVQNRVFDIDQFNLADFEAIRLANIGVIDYTTTAPSSSDADDYISGTLEADGTTTIYVAKADIPTVSDVAAFIFSDDFFQIYDNLFEMKTRENEEGLFWNYFLHIWQTWAVSRFAQFAVIKKAAAAGGGS